MSWAPVPNKPTVSVVVKQHFNRLNFDSEPVWPSGKAFKVWKAEEPRLDSAWALLSFLFKSCGLWTLSCDFVLHDYSDIKMALVAVHLNAEIILVVTV